jgi:superfamily II DNA or RNA helicase
VKTYGTLALSTSAQWWRLDAEPHVHLRVKRILGKVDQEGRGVLSLSNTPESCRDLEWVRSRYPLTMTPEHEAALTAGADAFREAILRLEQIIDTNYAAPEFSLALPLRDYQAREVGVYLTSGFLLNGDDVGLGKTPMAIGSFADPRTLPAVVVCMPHLQRQWRAQIAKFIPSLHVHIVDKATPYELPKFMGAGPDVVIITYHKLAGWSKVLLNYAKSVVYDEIQELRHSGSYRHEAARQLVDVPFRLGLSATPVYNYGGEIFNIFEVLKPGALGTSAEFHREHCTYGGGGEKAKLKDPKAFGTYLRESFLMIRHTRQEVKRELPAGEPIRHVQHVDTDRAALDAIDASAAELARILLSQAAPVQKMHAASELDWRLRQATGIAKAPHVADFIRVLAESEEKILLGGWHRAVYDLWLAKLADLQPVMYTGSETPAQKQKAIDAFVNGPSRLMIMSLRSGAGVDGLQQVCSACVIGELDWSPAVHDQFIGRIGRDGQQDPVVAYFLVSDEGSDPVIAEVNGIKREQQEGIRNPLAAESLERLEIDPERVKRLAEHYLRKMQKKRGMGLVGVPAAGPAAGAVQS